MQSGDSRTILSILSMIIIAPIIEELIFRGYLFNKWSETMGIKKSILLSSVLFALLHLNSNFIGLFICGLFYCIIYLKTKNLLVPILCHMLNNILSSIGVFASLKSNETRSELSISDFSNYIIELQGNLYYFIILFLIFLIFILFILFKITPRKNFESPYYQNINTFKCKRQTVPTSLHQEI
ncbi:CPBP family intramembrane metalloprotease [Bacillus sp. MM2020_1]|nr:CPBP family intramembrane metalloprotease [Bacillus sp. MM2020_1]